MTREPLGWTAVMVTEPAAVALALRTRLVPSVTLAIVAPAGMPVPKTCMPGTRPAVLATVTFGEALTVVATREVLAKASVPMLRAKAFEESGDSSMRPPPFWTASKAMPSVVEPAAEPPRASRPPCRFTEPPTTAPRRLLTLAPELSRRSVPPAFTLNTERAARVDSTAWPAPA